MKTDILSLRGLYQFLFVNDYPVFSTGIISRYNRLGLTLTKFWHENLLIDFRNQKYGKTIWRMEGSRNRYISDICNRSGRLVIYEEYAKEVCSVAEPDTVLRQIGQFMSFLTERNYDYAVFVQKLEAYIKLLAQRDVAFTKDAEDFFEEALKCKKEFDVPGGKGQVFFCSWFLTFMMLHALAGNGEGESHLRQLRLNPELSVNNLGRAYLRERKKESFEKGEKKAATYLTTNNSELCREALDIRHFFGREEEVFELREMLKAGGKYLISGIGGIGKTELMRQFLRICEEECLVDHICVVQYEENMANSLIKSFAQIRGVDKQENLQEALAIIRMHAKKKVLLIVDNVNHSVEEDADIGVLLNLPCTVFLTSRYQELDGFETYTVRPIGKRAGGLIFRDNYELPLNKEDKQVLENLLLRDIWCHTLTLRLLGRAAKVKNWTLQELLNLIEKNGKTIGLEEQMGYKNLQQLYRQMYKISGWEKDLNRFLQIFALLPYGSYETNIVHRYLQGFLQDNQDMEKSLIQLWESGWLEKRENGYSMHPFIAECVLVRQLTIAEIVPFLDAVIDAWKENAEDFLVQGLERLFIPATDIPVSSELKRMTVIALEICCKLPGAIEERHLQLLLLGVAIEARQIGVSGKRQEYLLTARERCKECSEITNVGWLTVLSILCYTKGMNWEEEYNKVMNMQNIPESLKNLFFIKVMSVMLEQEEYELLEKIAKYSYDKADNPYVRMDIMHLLANLAMQRGDYENCISYLRQGIEIGKGDILEKSEQMYLLRVCLANMMFAMGQFTEAEMLLMENRKNVADEESLAERWPHLFSMGSLKMNRGDEGFGIAELAEAAELAENLFVGYNEANCFKSVSELAMAYNKAKRREEACECYQKALAMCERMQGYEFDKHRILNNRGVMYLDWEKYEEALADLSVAYEMGKPMGGLAVAEPANNLSKVWNKLGDREKELQYLEEALPIMEHFYGSEHPKVVDAKKRKGEN